MNKVLVTGAAGFIGFHLSKLLVENGYEVVGIDNINDYYDSIWRKIQGAKNTTTTSQLAMHGKYFDFEHKPILRHGHRPFSRSSFHRSYFSK